MTIQNILGESKYKTFSNCFGHEAKKKKVKYYWDDPDKFEKEDQSFDQNDEIPVKGTYDCPRLTPDNLNELGNG